MPGARYDFKSNVNGGVKMSQPRIVTIKARFLQMLSRDHVPQMTGGFVKYRFLGLRAMEVGVGGS